MVGGGTYFHTHACKSGLLGMRFNEGGRDSGSGSGIGLGLRVRVRVRDRVRVRVRSKDLGMA